MDLPKRKPTRLKGYDYSTSGAYFITICVKDRKQMLSKIIVGDGVLDVPQNISDSIVGQGLAPALQYPRHKCYKMGKRLFST